MRLRCKNYIKNFIRKQELEKKTQQVIFSSRKYKRVFYRRWCLWRKISQIDLDMAIARDIRDYGVKKTYKMLEDNPYHYAMKPKILYSRAKALDMLLMYTGLNKIETSAKTFLKYLKSFNN